MAVPQVAASGRQQKSIVVEVNVPGVNGADKRFEKHVSACSFEPNIPTEQWQGGTPDAQLGATGNATYSCSITAIQAWHDPASFVRFLATNQGKSATITYYPHDDVAYGWQADIVLPAPTMGGKVNQFNESTVTVPCTTPKEVAVLPTAVATGP